MKSSFGLGICNNAPLPQPLFVTLSNASRQTVGICINSRTFFNKYQRSSQNVCYSLATKLCYEVYSECEYSVNIRSNASSFVHNTNKSLYFTKRWIKIIQSNGHQLSAMIENYVTVVGCPTRQPG